MAYDVIYIKYQFKDPEANKFTNSVRYMTHRASLVGITPTMRNYNYLTINPLKAPPLYRV